MSKEYTFQEVIQRIKPGQKYQCTVANYNVQEMFMYGSVLGSLEIKQTDSDKAIMISPEARYVLVQQPVSFMEAINSGKRIKPAIEKEFSSIVTHLSKLGHMSMGAGLARINGNWYIEEED